MTGNRYPIKIRKAAALGLVSSALLAAAMSAAAADGELTDVSGRDTVSDAVFEQAEDTYESEAVEEGLSQAEPLPANLLAGDSAGSVTELLPYGEPDRYGMYSALLKAGIAQEMLYDLVELGGIWLPDMEEDGSYTEYLHVICYEVSQYETADGSGQADGYDQEYTVSFRLWVSTEKTVSEALDNPDSVYELSGERLEYTAEGLRAQETLDETESETFFMEETETETILTEEAQTQPTATDAEQTMTETGPSEESGMTETPDSEDTAPGQDDIIGSESSDALIADDTSDGSQTQMSEDISGRTPEDARELLDAFGQAIADSISAY